MSGPPTNGGGMGAAVGTGALRGPGRELVQAGAYAPAQGQLLALAETALGHTTGQAQVTVTAETSLAMRFARSVPTQATAICDTVVEVLSLVDGHTVACSTNVLDDDSLRSCADRAYEAALAVARASSEPGEYPALPEPAPMRAHGGHDAATAAVEPGRGGSALAGAFEAAGRAGCEAFGIWTAGEVRAAIVSTSGTNVFDAVTDAHMRVICRDEHARSGFAAATAVASGHIDGATIARAAAARITAGASSGEPVALGPGEYTVVLDVEAVGTLLYFLAGLAFDGMAYAEERGALCGRMGTSVAAPCINLSDSPRHPATLARAFDAEGVPKAPLPLIQDGVAHRVTHDTRSAARAGAGAHSTGHALGAGGGHGGPMPTNLVLVGGGAADVAELAAGVQRGLFVTRLHYVNTVRERETLLTGTTRDGTYLIEDGVISRPVQDVRFTDSVLRILSATDALSATQRLVSEGEFYGRRFAYGAVCPALRAHGFRVTGAAAGA